MSLVNEFLDAQAEYDREQMEMQPVGKDPNKPGLEIPSFAGITASELSTFAGEPVDWLVDRVIASDQPTIFGARSKAGKTTQLTDLSVALATGTDWLGHFPIRKARRVLFITGEANQRSMARKLERAIKARGFNWEDMGDELRVETIEFPKMPNIFHRDQITKDIKEHDIAVVIVDPLYRGLGDLDTNRMAEMGDAIVQFAKACQPAALIISHHTTKAAAREYGVPPSLEDLSGAGLAESCGNWWLLGRNEPYQFDRKHDLCVQYGGRDEQSGLVRILFDEKDWTFEVKGMDEFKEDQKRDKEAKKQEARQTKMNEAKASVKHCLANVKEPKPKSWIESRTIVSQAQTRAAIAELLNNGKVTEAPYKDARGVERQGGLILTSLVDPLNLVNGSNNETLSISE